jgi:2'-5' RNA ligase
MPEQGVFDFYREWPVRPQRPERLFFGVLPGCEAADRVAQFRECFIDRLHLKGSRIEPGRLHLSLHWLGDEKRLRSPMVHAATRAGSAISMSPFEVTFRFIQSFESTRWINGRPRWPLVLLGESNDLFGLHHNLGTAIKKNGLRAAELFTPHITLLYGLRPVALQAIEPIRFVVNEFVLIHSELWLTRYNMIRRWSLQG